MASYPYSTAPPPCKNTTSPILLPPPPPPPPACNHTTPPTHSSLQSPPPPAHDSPSPPSLSPTPCNCSKTTPTLPPPPLPSPPPPSSYYSPPLASSSPPPLPPPSSRYSPPVHSPPPPSPSQPSPILPPPSPPSASPRSSYIPSPSPPLSDYSPPLPSKSSPPKPLKTKASPTPSLQPATPPPSPSPYSFPQTPVQSPLSPDPPCHCACPSPWAIPPNHYNSIPPNYYDSTAPAPSPLSSSNNERTVIVTAFVSLGGVFFLATLVYGLISVAMKKKILSMPRLSGRPRVPETDQLSHEVRREHVQEFKNIPAGTEHVIEMGDPDSKVQEVPALPDQGIVQQGEAVQRIPSVIEKKSVDPNVDGDSFGDNQGKEDSDMKLGEPSSEQSVDKIEDADEGKSNEGNNKPLDDHKDASPDEENKSKAIREESNEGAPNESEKKPRIPKIKKPKRGKKGKEQHSGIRKLVLDGVNVVRTFDSDETEQPQDGDSDEGQVSDTEAQDDNKKLLSDGTNYEDEKVERPTEEKQEAEERDDKPLSDQTETNKTDSTQDVNERSSAVGEESSDSKNKLRPPKKNKSSSSRAKTGKEKHSGISQYINVAHTFVPDEVEENQDGDNGEDENVESPTEEEQEAEECDDKPLSDQNETNKTDFTQDVTERSSAIGEESGDSKNKLRPSKKNKSSSSRAKTGKEKHSGIPQYLNVAHTFVPDEVEENQDGDNGEDENVESPTEEERDDKPLSDQNETNKTDSTQDVNERSSAIGEESGDSKNKLRPSKKNKSSSSRAKTGKEKHYGIPQYLNVAHTFVPDEVEGNQDGDNGEDENVESPTEEEREAEERDDKPLSDQNETNKTDSTQDVNERSRAIGEESGDSKNKLRPSKKNKSSSSRAKTGKEKHSGIPQYLNVAHTFVPDEVEENQDGDNGEDKNVESPTEEEREAEERDDKPLRDQNETNKTDSTQDVNEGSSAVGEESSDSKNKLRPPKKKKSSSSRAKTGKEKHSGIPQYLNVAHTFVPDEVEENQDGDNGEEQVGILEDHDDDAELVSDGTHNAEKNVEPPIEDEQEAEERDGKPLDDQIETNKMDCAQDVNEGSNAVGGESSNHTKKLRLPEKNKSSNSAKTGKESQYGILQDLTATSALDPNEAGQTQDGDNDKEQVSEYGAQDDDKEFLSDGTNYADEKVEGPTEEEREAEERDDKPLSDQTDTNKTESTQDVNERSSAVGEESSDSKKKLRLPKKNNSASNSGNKRKGKPSSSSGVTKGKEQLFGVSQVPIPASIFDLGGAENFQDGDNDEEPYRSKPQDDKETYELEPQDDDKELIAGGSNSADEIVKHANADEQELNERHGEPLSHHRSERYTRDSAQHVEEEPDAFEEESKEKKSLSSSGLKNGKEESSGTYFDPDDAPQDDNNDAGVVTQLEPLDDGENLNSGGLNNASEEVEPPANADADVSNECEQKSLEFQSESDNRGASQDAEQESTAIKEESDDRSQKTLGNQSYTKNADATQDVEKLYASKENSISSQRKQALKKGGGSSTRSHPQGKIQYSNFGQLLNKSGDVYSEALQSQEDDSDGVQMQEYELQHDGDDLNSGGNDSSRAMDSLDNEEGEVEVSDLFASAQGSKQALSKIVVLDGGDYKDDKAKVHEMKSGSSNKDPQERQQRTQAKKHFNLGKIGTAASRRDPGMAKVSFEDEDDKVQESEPFASNVDSYLGELQTNARGIEQSPIFSPNLITKSDDDPAEELKSLGDGNYKGKKAEVHALSKDSGRIKGQVIGPGTRTEPPKLNQIVTGRIDDDLGILGKGLECLGGNQEGGSGKDGSGKEVIGSGQTSRGPQQISNLVQSLAATDEGDPNPGLEICEDDRGLESDLSLQEPSASELEPSTDDQSVFVTADDDSDVLQFLDNEYDEEPGESNRDAPPGKPPSRPRTTNLKGKRRA